MFNRDTPSFHSTQKPVALIEYLIKTYTNENDTILDFTAGSGTTGIAAMETNRKCVLIEKEEKYCEITIKRLQEKEKEIAERLF
jgi:site-specific DNA-methyltransferase (adenine-specific)